MGVGGYREVISLQHKNQLVLCPVPGPEADAGTGLAGSSSSANPVTLKLLKVILLHVSSHKSPVSLISKYHQNIEVTVYYVNHTTSCHRYAAKPLTYELQKNMTLSTFKK